MCLYEYESQHPKSISYGAELKKEVEYTYQTADAKNHCGSFGFCCGTGTLFYDGYTFNSLFLLVLMHFLTIPRNCSIITFRITTQLKLFNS
jgi:hypothetical protein